MTTQPLVLTLADVLEYLDMLEYDEQFDTVYPYYNVGDIIIWPKLIIEVIKPKRPERNPHDRTPSWVYLARAIFDSASGLKPYNYIYVKNPHETDWVLEDDKRVTVNFRVFRKASR